MAVREAKTGLNILFYLSFKLEKVKLCLQVSVLQILLTKII